MITLTFESRLTMRFQVQEMARAEKMVTDEQIQHELDVYNRLLPAPGELSATLFLELTTRGGAPHLAAAPGGHRARLRAPHRDRSRLHRGRLRARVGARGQPDP